VELLPRTIIAGLYVAVAPTMATPVTEEKINRIWSEVAPRAEYRQLQIADDGSAAQFVGRTEDDGATIQLPLVQVRSSIGLKYGDAVDRVHGTLKAIANHLSLDQFFNLGIKHVYHAPIPNHDARDFVLRKLLQKGASDLDRLQRGGDLWTGLKVGTSSADGAFYSLTFEPWLRDNEWLFVDLDAQFPGVATLETVKDRAKEAHEFARGAIKDYLDAAETDM
jgi:hypothetical protein